MKNKESRQVLGRRVLAPALILALIAVMVFPAAAALVYPTVTVSPIGAHTIGDTVVVSATSTTPCYRMAAKVEYNGTTTWLTDSYTNSFYDTFVVSNTGVYTVTVYARSYEPSDPRSANSGATPISFIVYAPHVHSYDSIVFYEDAHPHFGYRRCTSEGVCSQPIQYTGGTYPGNYYFCEHNTGAITKHWCANDENLTQLKPLSSETFKFCKSYTTTVTDNVFVPGYTFTHSLVTDSNGNAVQSTSSTRTVTVTASSPYAYVRYQFNENVGVDYVTIQQGDQNLDVGDTVQLSYTITPPTAMNLNCTWISSDTSVATVSASGLLTAVGPGDATITLDPEDPYGDEDWIEVHVSLYDLDVENYFDYAFSTRIGGDSVAEAFISNVVGVAQNVFGSVFGLQLHETKLQKYSSLTDRCFLNRTPPITDYLAAECLIHTPRCTDVYRAYNDFEVEHSGTEFKTTALWTGKVLFGNGANGSFIEDSKAISMENLPVNDNYIVSDFADIYVHELAHSVGAVDHYHYGDVNVRCKNEYCNLCGSNPRPTTCQMNNLRLGEASGNYSDLFCDGCKMDIVSHLANHH